MPQLSHAVRLEAEAAGHAHGYRGNHGELNGWLHLKSMTAPGDIWITARTVAGPWYVAVEHAPVITELEWESVARSGPGAARYIAIDIENLRVLVQRIYRLAVSLPDTPLLEFKSRTSKMPRTTEVERIAVQRVGQDIFRARLLDYWDGACPLTGITDPQLLRASHIKPWSACASDSERLNVYNGLLLSSLWDASFDSGLVSFAADGTPLLSSMLSEAAMAYFSSTAQNLKLTAGHKGYLEWHRAEVWIDG
jgi:hypothetical protein